MATKIVMEALSPTMEEGRLVAWKKKEGDPVKAGETLAEVETDKAVMELVSRTDGVLRKIVAGEGQTVPVSTLVAIVGAPDEDIAALLGGPGDRGAGGPGDRGTAGPTDGGARRGGAAAPAPAVAPPAPAERAQASAPPAPAAPTAPSRVRSSPLARRLAAERGLELGRIAGSGPQGRVVKRDVEAAPIGPVAVAGPPSVVPRLPSAGTEDVPLTQIRKTIAKRLVQSLGPIPHFFLTSEMDMERAFEARAALKAKGDAYAVSFNDIVIKAVALALRQHRAVNAWWLEDHIRYHGEVHVGMAVAVEDGLITPVIRNADLKGLLEIAAESRELAERARARRLRPEEYTGATFSVSNLGMFDIDEFTAVINPPEAGILAVGRIVEKPAVAGGQVAVRRQMRVTMSCDHRVIDGATGARFLQTVKLMLENPLAMVL
jgi:pyruvate dehydrogenase E2 component (dihydrolipoamide acetyltransferase)